MKYIGQFHPEYLKDPGSKSLIIMDFVRYNFIYVSN